MTRSKQGFQGSRVWDLELHATFVVVQHERQSASERDVRVPWPVAFAPPKLLCYAVILKASLSE